MLKHALLVAATSLLTFSAQAQQACTQMGCESGLLVQVPQVRFHAPGKYHFAFTLDGKEKITCTGSLPMRSCDTPALSCSSPDVSIMEEGCALPADAQRFGDIRISSSPKKLHLETKLNGKTIAYQDFTPKYQTVAPNGAQCGPVCHQASVNLKTQ